MQEMPSLTLREYQQEQFQAVRSFFKAGYRRVLISASTGTGKCVSPDTWVWSKGLVRMGDLWGSDRILGPHGVAKIDCWYDDGERDGKLVELECGVSVDGTDEHKLFVCDENGHGWKRCGDIKPGDYVAMSRGLGDFGDLAMDPKDAYLLGLLVADGCITSTNGGTSYRLQIDKQRVVLEAVSDTVLSWIRRSGGRISNGISITDVSLNHAYLCARSTGFKAFLENEFGLYLVESSRRVVPSSVLKSDRATVRQFLRGYFDGDGYCDIAPSVSTASRTLAEQIFHLLFGLGVACRIRQKKTKGLDAHIVIVRDVEAFEKEVGFTKYGLKKDENYRRILEKKRNTNLDIVPGVGGLIRGLAENYPGHTLRKDSWRHAGAYFSDRMPSYEKLEEFLSSAPDCEEKRQLLGIVATRYFWSKVESVSAKRSRRIDCQVAEQHAFVGNSIVNHNTVLLVFLCHAVVSKGRRAMVLVNTDELVRQTVDKFAAIGVRAGIVKSGVNEWDETIVVASVQTISRRNRLEQIPKDQFGLIIVDECHYANSNSYQRVLRYFDKSFMLGVSATLFRGDGRSLARGGWEAIAHVYPIERAIRDGWLVPPIAFRIETDTNLDDVPSVKNAAGEEDFDTDKVSKAVNTVGRNSTIVDTWLKRAEHRKTIGFCADVAHAFDLANAFRARGIDARVVHGGMPIRQRRDVLQAHKEGRFPVLVNCAVLTHGYDDPSISCVVMAKPTRSKTLAIQCVGRGLRPHRSKIDCLILDFVDMTTKHKLVTTDDIIRLQKEMRGEQVAEEEDSHAIQVGPIVDESKAKEKKKVFSNEEDAEAWRAQQIDLLESKRKKDARPATNGQRKFLFIKLKELKWPEAAAKKAAFELELTMGGLPKFLGRAKYGYELPEKYM